MQFKCQECGKEFKSRRSLHTHIKVHDLFVGDYYVKYYPRFDKLTNQPIEYKNYDQYFATDFINISNMKKWCDQAPREEVREFIKKSLKEKLGAKGIQAGPPSTYLLTGGLPDIDICKQMFGSYRETCQHIDMLPMLSASLPKDFQKDYSDTPILIDTREQQPLSFNNSDSLKLDVGDYAVGGDLYDYTFVDRKSYQDFCSTITNGYSRFIKELERCRSIGCFLYIVTETAFDDMWATNKKGFKKFKLDYVYHQMRSIQSEYTDCCQFVFSGSREKSEELIPKILVLGKKLWKVDLQYFWDKEIKKDGLGNRKTETPQRVQGYKQTHSRKRGVFRRNGS